MLRCRQSLFKGSFCLRRTLATASWSPHLATKYPVGQALHGYEIKRVLPVPEWRLVAVDLVHGQTGAQHLHLDRADNNNVFSIGFRTLPPDSTGVPHILEHTTLCGSVKYPVHDPFFKMLNKSLANFMNAMTGPHYTFFPFATTNGRDFANLRDVYLDSILNPLLKWEDFVQEGWRLENRDLEDKTSEIVFKGVVYNEMKGQISNADYFFWSQFQQALYPDLNNSGGDPQKITDLTYEDLVKFHRNNYHASNARTFTYGDFPLEDTLKRLNKEFVEFGRRQSPRALKQLDFDKDMHIVKQGQFDPMLPEEKQTKTSMTWKIGDSKDTYETFLWRVLGNILMDGQSSVLYQRLIDTGIGTEFTVNCGVDTLLDTNVLTVGVTGVSDVDAFRACVNDVFQKVAVAPIEEMKVNAIIQQLELSKKDHKPDFGLQLLYSILPGWTNSMDPFEALKFEELIHRFREDFATRGSALFHDLVKKWILDKPIFHFSMVGSKELAKELEEEEQARLKNKVAKLDTQDRQIIYDRGLLLRDKQAKKENLSCLPTLQTSDISREAVYYPVEMLNDQTMVRITDTNGITYMRGKIEMNDLIPHDLYAYLPLFADSLTSLGTKTKPFKDIEDEIKLNTGGISSHSSVTTDPLTLQPRLNLGFDGWCLNHKGGKVVDLWDQLILNTDFNANKNVLKVLIKILASSAVSSVTEAGHSFARGYATAHFSKTKAIAETLGGIEQLKFVMQLNSYLEDESLFQTMVVDKLVQLQLIMMNCKDRLRFFVTTDTTNQAEAITGQLATFRDKFLSSSNESFTTGDYPLLSGTKPTLLNFPFQTHYTAYCENTNIPYVHADTAPLQILSSILTSKHLHKEIRESGGAYGGGAGYDSLVGSFNYYSYRDPTPLRSLQVFHRTFDIEAADVTNGKLRLFQDIDAPISRRGEAVWNFENGITHKMRQERRERFLDTTSQDVERVRDKYLKRQPGYGVVVGAPIPGKTDPPAWDTVTLSAS
ncbi:pitrilysin family metalloprotease KNAG_0C03170 [Huiozyma naganishii CBS 8797]|uniref:Presequence protease, mitochondrial n=1 Tax=Huiozyma naganishii (strain ATCC MYA-139 / BCRC 22969 / CBS 8797 / KCTC 17520 / NBRC 10181 / NCYC 3082 / Yp74L-3) TaxID=1071383 RepID=J7RWN6_HUIN7|nr:hypothetical protein KNAG_0C03170 [Kazachstania naganishii CBS 8797]CCK69427.1 hypothetical protein KNAG_0C03170 [Kazachstania naganishii CBS 8797]